MRTFIKVFLFCMFGTVFGMDNVLPRLDEKLKDAKQETLVVFNCEGIIFSYVDAAFFKDNDDVWSGFLETRSNLERIKDEKIDRSLFYAPKRIISMQYKQNFEKLQKQGINIVFVYQINKNRMKFHEAGMIKSFIFSILNDIGMNPNNIDSVKLLITDSEKFSSELAEIVKDFSKSDAKENKNTDKETKNNKKVGSIKNIILVHEGSLQLDKKQLNLPIEEIIVDTKNTRMNISKDQMKRQLEILQKTGEWMDDWRIQRITNRSDEEIIYELCKQSIIDVCPCHEIIEKEIYEKVSNIISNKDSLTYLNEIIDDFQEVNNTLMNIFHYALRSYFWDACFRLGITEQKAIELLEKVESLYFNEHEAREAAFKVLKRLGCGIHWRDMAKYNYIKHFIMTGEKLTQTSDVKHSEIEKTSEMDEETLTSGVESHALRHDEINHIVDTERYKIYMKVFDMVFDRMNSSMTQVLEDFRDKFIKVLHENKVEDKKIMNVFKISEEKFKNIANVKPLKNEERDIKNEKK